MMMCSSIFRYAKEAIMVHLIRATFFASILLAASCAQATGLLEGLLLKKDASGYAQRMADLIDDRLECRVFKQEILAHSHGSPYSGKTVSAIVNAQQKAIAAGCSSPNAVGKGMHGVANKMGQVGAAVLTDAHGYAQRMAALIDDRPECSQYKAAILVHAGGSMASGATVMPIIQAKQAANKAGCSKP
jgi:hypothetical protein